MRTRSGPSPCGDGSYGLSCPAIHAEQNALMHADGTAIEGGTIYITRRCCQDCAKMIANSGVARVVMLEGPNDDHLGFDASREFLEASGLTVITRSKWRD